MAYDVFVSYSSPDRTVVERIAQRLRDAGLTPWFDRWALTAGHSWQEEIAAGIAGSGACAVCVGPGDVGDWSREELEIALVRAADDRGFRVFVVLLPGVGDVSGLSPFLVTRTWVDLRGGLGDLQPLINAVRGVPAGSGAPAPDVRANPYRGLRPFEEDDADTFFGRAVETRQALEKLRAARFLAVVGASGSGKSSLVRAGLLPPLRASGGWTVVVLKPGATPLETLAVQLARADPRTVREQLRSSVDGLHLLGRVALADAPDEARLLVVVDQFEEVFTRCRDESERRRFIENLVYAATAADGRIVVVLTLRADFYPRCAAYPELAHLLTSHQALLGPMGADALREAIEAPALGAGGEFEAGLVDLLLEEVEGRPGALPLLEHTLYELWERRSGRMLTLEAYRRTGGVSGAVAHRAEAVFTALSPDEQAIARRVMLRLTEPGEGTEDTRRRAELDELTRSPAEAGAVAHVVGALADARLLTTSEDVVDVAHEALIRGWPRLRGWIDEDRDHLRAHRRLAETAEEWERLNRDPSLLFRGVRLAEARALDTDDLNERERAFLAASGAQEASELEQVRELARTRQRATRRLVWAAAILLVGVVVSSLAAIWALRARDDAQQQATVALARQLIVQSREESADHLDTAALRALAAARLHPGAETEAALADIARTEPRLTVLRPSGARLLALQANARTAVTVDERGAVTRWDLVQHRPVGAPWRIPRPTTAAISGDLRTLAAAGSDDQVQLWDLTTRQKRGPQRHAVSGELFELALDDTGAHLVASNFELGSSLWTVGTQWRRLRVGARPSDAIAIAPDARHATIVPQFGRGRVVTVPDGRRVTALPEGVTWASFTADGRRISLEYEQGEELRTLAGRRLWRVADSSSARGPDGSVIVEGDGFDDVVVRDPREGLRWPPLTGLDLSVRQLAFAGPEQVLAGGSDGALGLWTFRSGPAFRVQHRPEISGLSADARTAASWSPEGRLSIIDLATGSTIGRVQAPVGLLRVAAMSAGGRWVALAGTTASHAWELWLWDRRRGGPMLRLEMSAETSALGFSRDALAAVGTDGSLVTVDLSGAWPPEPRQAVRGVRRTAAAPPSTDVLGFGRLLETAHVSSDGRHVLALDRTTQEVVEYDVAAGTRRVRAGARELTVAGDGRTAATVGRDGTVSIWHLPGWTRSSVAVARVPDDAAPLALSSGGGRLAISDSQRGVTVWDTATGTRVNTLNAGNADILRWDRDQLYTVGPGGLSRWDLSRTGLWRRVCAAANRNLTRAEWRAIAGADRPYARLCPPGG